MVPAGAVHRASSIWKTGKPEGHIGKLSWELAHACSAEHMWPVPGKQVQGVAGGGEGAKGQCRGRKYARSVPNLRVIWKSDIY